MASDFGTNLRGVGRGHVGLARGEEEQWVGHVVGGAVHGRRRYGGLLRTRTVGWGVSKGAMAWRERIRISREIWCDGGAMG